MCIIIALLSVLASIIGASYNGLAEEAELNDQREVIVTKQTTEVAGRLVWFFAKEREAILATYEVGQLIEQVCMCGLILD